MDIKGTERPKSFLIKSEPAVEYSQSSPFGEYRSSPYPSNLSADAPTLPELMRFKRKTPKERCNVLAEIGTKYRTFGTILLQDETGAIINNIELKRHFDAEWINWDILGRWIDGREDIHEGIQPVTWETLADVLEDCDMKTLADDIRAAKC